MSPRVPFTPRPRTHSGIIRRGDSWLSLVAATTEGLGQFTSLRVTVAARTSWRSCPLRLVVQAYASMGSTTPSIPPQGVHPIASIQRAVTAEALNTGLEIDLVHTAVPDATLLAAPFILAWVEPGLPNLEFDGLLARPTQEAQFGFAESTREGSGLQALVALGAA